MIYRGLKMTFHKFLLKLMLGVYFMIIGCRLNYLSEYSREELVFDKSVITVALMGTYKNKKENGKDVRYLANPYSLIIRYLSRDLKFDYAELLNLEMRSTTSNRQIKFEKKYKREIKGKDVEGNFFTGFSLDNLIIEYDDYEVTGVLFLYSEDKELFQKNIKVILKREYSEKKTNDTIDGIMGI
jgi:hypothetical protein